MRRVVAAVAALVLLAVTGCATIDTTGPVEEVPFSAQPPGIDVAPEPPQAGVTPTRLVEGFLQAMADPEGDYAVARQYLTDEANRTWDPHGAVVYEGTVTGDAGSGVLDGTAVGLLDPTGHYTAVAEKLGHDFGLTRQGDQWRIGLPPMGCCSPGTSSSGTTRGCRCTT
ncbi:hypothetical protein G7085_00740 [Tessaracoccus sp. HDW20]|uniref:hypothetical protein n=1 Tax=Tessaracoccus coleopterorum TaxID=2714950 RepID=UPI0018D354BD|nr:hypothetical protein [Tessaracoccus coleopterorum]NHB83721.1 hypothetical protein [Tessaracoccus coleopterorum]